MKKITFGKTEEFVPSRFCKNFSYKETDISYPIENIKFEITKDGCIIQFPLDKKEAIYGFGLQLKGFNQKSKRLMLRANSDPLANTGDSHAPVPFFCSTNCYGMYIDTARYIEVYCGVTKKKKKRNETQKREVATTTEELYSTRDTHEETIMSIKIPSAKGVDIYIFEGENILDVVSQYNMLSGGGCNPPEWGLGVLYRACGRYNQEQVMDIAKYFRNSDIPCDILGLEPGWQTGAYPCTYAWSEERFPEYKKLIKQLKEMNFHINLWEHAFTSSASPIYDEIYPHSGDYEVWGGLVPDFGTQEARKIFADYHKNNFVNCGIDGFKLDECDGSDYTNNWSFPNFSKFPSGLDGEQYHQLFGTLYMQTILDALGDIKTFSEVRNAGALAASYPFVLYSDLYDHKDFIRGVVNSGFSGLLWTPELRDAKSKKELIRRMQTTVFSVQCLINAWYCEEVPWKEFDCENEVRELLELRKSLVPMLKKAFEEYESTGKPPVRALVADYTDDEQTYSIDDEYIFCDNLIVAPLTEESDERNVYLPKGKWCDFYTKEAVESGWFTVATDKIPVYEKCE